MSVFGVKYGPHFPAIGLRIYSASLRIHSECGKMRTKITPNTDIYATLGTKHRATLAENSLIFCKIDSYLGPTDPLAKVKLDLKTVQKTCGILIGYV